MSEKELHKIIDRLLKLPKECEWADVILFAHKTLNEMGKYERIQACYQHCCLRYVMNEKTTNQSVRERFKIVDSNYPIASKIIKETLVANLIKEGEALNQSNRSINYIPFWA